MAVAVVLGQNESELQLLPGTADPLLLTRGGILSHFFPPTHPSEIAEMQEILQHDVRRLLRHGGTQTITIFCTEKMQF